MAFMTVKIQPGVKTIPTPTLLQANIVSSNLIRWRSGLPEKFGGWMNFFSNVGTTGGPSDITVGGLTRAMCAWSDLNITNHLGVAGTAGLSCLTPVQNGTPAVQEISPQYAVSTSGQTFTTTAGSPIVTIFDPGAQINNYSSIQVQCHVAVGGIVIFGSFPVVAALTAQQYTIQLPFNAISSASAVTTPDVALFTAVANSQVIKVTLTAHGMVAGSSFPIPMPTLVGSAPNQVTLVGFYTVQQVIDANNFIIFAQQSVPNPGTTYEANLGGAPQIIYWVAQAPLLPNAGWGVGGWGVGGWGSGEQPTPLSAADFPPPPGTVGFGNVSNDDWDLANWGSQLISLAIDGPLFQWDPTSGIQNAQKIANGPGYAHGFFIGMPEQQIIAYGASTGQVQDPMLVAWCDNANYNTWTAAVSNQAGTFRLTRGSKIMGGLQGPQQAMLWTDVGLWVMQYIGYPNVFGFNEVAQGCGLIGKHAVAVYGPQVFWMGRDAFWMYSNGVVQRLQCDVWNVVIQNLNNKRDGSGNYIYHPHIRGGANSDFDEVIWFYPSRDSTTGENDAYVKFNPVTGEWDYGLSSPQLGLPTPTPIRVTSWVDHNVFGHPLSSMIAPSGADSMIVQHEMGQDANGQPITWMIQTGIFMLQEGEDKVFVDYMLPDFRYRRWVDDVKEQTGAVTTASAQVQITLYTTDVPDYDAWVPYGPFLVTEDTGPVEVRCRGRYFMMQAQGNDLGSFVRLGGVKFRFAPDGRN